MNNQSPRYFCVIAAAGIGQRMGGDTPKQYLKVQERTLLEWSLQPFLTCTLIEKIVVVLSKEDQRFASLAIADHPKVSAVVGGDERYHSVLSGLHEIAKNAHDNDWVMVHDAARPNIALGDLNQFIKAVGDHPVGGILGTPISDSLKQVDQNQFILSDSPREQIWRAFTPQLFRLGIVKDSLEEALREGLIVTDESSAVTRRGHSVMMVPGRADNIKVTTPADYFMIQQLIKEEQY